MIYDRFYPGQVWLDTEGKPIHAHGGSVIYVDGTYYWYGENKEKSVGDRSIWHWGVRCYASKDLYNWEDKGLIIPPDLEDETSPLHPSAHMDRPHIIYNEATKKYVCWLKVAGLDNKCQQAVLTADHILGPYTYATKQINALGMYGADFDLGKDSDGRAYYYFACDSRGLICADLTADYTDVTGEFSTHFPGYEIPFLKEAPAHFERNGKHYLITSGTTSYYPNPSEVHIANTWHGPFQTLGRPHVNDESETSFHSQVSCVFKVEGKKDLYIACADRWMPDCMHIPYPLYRDLFYNVFKQGGGSEEDCKALEEVVPDAALMNTSKARYVWLPIRFDGEMAYIDWHDEWRLEDMDTSATE